MNDTTNWEKVKDIFSSALDVDFELREGFVAQMCGGDESLHAEVRSWLTSHAESEGFIDTPAFSAREIFSDLSFEGRQFGNYTIIREIGHGGMGAVYLARRTDGEFEQQVALKIVRGSVADSGMVERFRQERQILASLNHPNIAKLLDGGVSASGEPFLAMEYIEGETIGDFVSRTNLSVEEILALFVKVCSAVSYAHRNLIVHRDIKPGNILVTADGEPKLLDFGLAKLSEPITPIGNLDNQQTQTAFRALTPAYASPEQLKGETLTTTSDIYSLGIVFYELLTGDRPFHFEGMSFDEILKTMVVFAPPLPSANVKSTTERRQLKGDLDNIALMALRKEPERRYQSVDQFSADIGRYLIGLPVLARPNTFKYRTSKFFGRHRLSVVAAGLIFISLIAGIAVSMWQARVAQREKVKAEIVNTFLQGLLDASNPDTNLSNLKRVGMTVKEVLDTASLRLDGGELTDQAEVRAELQRIIGASYLAQGEYVAAGKNLRAALETETNIYGEDSPETLQILVPLAALSTQTGDTDAADSIFRRRLSILRSEHKKGNIRAEYLMSALNDYGLVLRSRGFSSDAESQFLEALSLRDQISPEGQNLVGNSEAVYALALSDRGKFDEAIDIVRPKIERIRQQENSETPELCGNLTALGSFLAEKGDLDEAHNNLAKAEILYRKLYSPTYVPLGDNLRLSAQVLYLQGNVAAAEIKIAECLKIYRGAVQPTYINYATALTIKGLILNRAGRSHEAEQILREAVDIRYKNLPREHFLTALTSGALGECLMAEGKYAEAEPFLVSSFENLKNQQEPDNPRTLLAQQRVANLYQVWKKPN